ncbi:hypothetical protein KCTC52924_01974 [Arenibacter antarcticus]|uniref:Uncharacterized protein n=1 Tax=Arenibacter antarcticus TaxID=2040469 RepID=A0ABW5VFR8_9FLAO|nr:hypothetical protein [Arenibacter sp. H213]
MNHVPVKFLGLHFLESASGRWGGQADLSNGFMGESEGNPERCPETHCSCPRPWFEAHCPKWNGVAMCRRPGNSFG